MKGRLVLLLMFDLLLRREFVPKNVPIMIDGLLLGCGVVFCIQSHLPEWEGVIGE